jgi:hypothetical protein
MKVLEQFQRKQVYCFWQKLRNLNKLDVFNDSIVNENALEKHITGRTQP